MSRLLEGDFILGHHDIIISRGKKSLPFSRGRIQVLTWKSKLFLPSRATRRLRMEVCARADYSQCSSASVPNIRFSLFYNKTRTLNQNNSHMQ